MQLGRNAKVNFVGKSEDNAVPRGMKRIPIKKENGKNKKYRVIYSQKTRLQNSIY